MQYQNPAIASPVLRPRIRHSTGCGVIGRTLLIWYLVGIFAVISLQVGGLFVTCFFSFPAALLMVARNYHLADAKELFFVGLVLLVGGLSVLFGLNADFMPDRFQSFLLFNYSFFMAYGLRLELARADRQDIVAVSGGLLAAILTAAVLEVLGPLRPVSDAFRTWNSLFPYTSDARDLALAGFIRPKVFTQEPSYAAIGIAVFSFVWLVTSTNRYRFLLFFAATGLAIFLLRSPVSFVVFPALAILILERLRRMRGLFGAMVFYFVGLCVLGAVVGGIVLIESIMSARAVSGGQYGDQSTIVRLLAPSQIAGQVIAEAPLFGAGLGGRDAIISQVQLVFDSIGVAANTLNTSVQDTIPNAFWEHWIYLGLLGGSVSALALAYYFRSLCKGRWVAAAVFVILLANTFGAYSTPRIWSYATLVFVACAFGRADTRQTGATTTVSR